MSETVRRPPDDPETAWRKTFRYIFALFALSLVSLILLLVALTVWWSGLRTQAEILRLARTPPATAQPRATPSSQSRSLPHSRAESPRRANGSRGLHRPAPDRWRASRAIARKPPSPKPEVSPSPVRITPRKESSPLQALRRKPQAQIQARLSAVPPLRARPARVRTRSSALRASPAPRKPTQVPNLIGLTLRQARARARGKGYWLVFRGVVPHPARPGTVIWQDPPAGIPAQGGRYLGYRMSNGTSGNLIAAQPVSAAGSLR
jgi:hypothetical protein